MSYHFAIFAVDTIRRVHSMQIQSIRQLYLDFFQVIWDQNYMNLKNREVEFSQIFLLNFGLAFENKLAYHESSWNINFVWAVHFYYQHFKLLHIFVLIHFIPSLAVWPKTIRVQKFISWKLWIYLKFLTNRNNNQLA